MFNGGLIAAQLPKEKIDELFSRFAASGASVALDWKAASSSSRERRDRENCARPSSWGPSIASSSNPAAGSTTRTRSTEARKQSGRERRLPAAPVSGSYTNFP
jgi:hypothetical protein